MDILFERYADLIVRDALKLKKGDVLSINTEEANSELAHVVARIARKITGNGSFIQIIENGKVTDTEEVESDFPINLKPTALLYLPVYRAFEEAEAGKIFGAPEIQRYRHLSDPLDNPLPSIPFVTAPVPSNDWGHAIDEEWNVRESASLLSELLSLADDNYLSINSENEDVLLYEKEKLNSMKLEKCRIVDENGTDLEFSFLSGSEFSTTLTVLSSGRRFKPTVFSADIFRAIDQKSAEGYFTITHPIMVFGKIINNLSCRVEHGRIVDFTTDEESGRIFSLFLSQEEKAGRISDLTLAEEGTTASNIEIFGLPEWDRMRSVSITIGGPRPESLATDDAKRNANDSLLTLTLPIGTDATTIIAFDENGIDYVIMEDGFLRED